jgi:hypothetical protein
VADVLALDNVDNVFGDVGGVVADALEVLGYQDQFEGWEDYAGVTHHVGQEFAEDLVTKVVDLVVHGQDFLGELDVAAHYGVQGVANHFFGDLAHAREIDVRFHSGVAKDTNRGLRDVYGLIADALQVIVDPGDGQDEAEVYGHQLMQSEELDYAVVDFDLEFIDSVFFVENTFGQLLVGVEDGVDGLVDGALGEAAHPEQALFEFVQVFFEVAFHGFLSAE